MLKIKDGFTGERSIVLPQAVVSVMEKDPLVRNLFVTDIGFYPDAAHHFRERKQPVNQFVLIHCVKGQGWFETDGRRRIVVAGRYFIIPAGKVHSYGSSDDSPWTIYWMHIRGELARFYAEHANEPVAIEPSVFSRISERLNVFDEILNTLADDYNIENLRYMSGLLTFFLSSMRYINLYRKYSSEKIDATNIVEASKHFMQENLSRRLSLKQLSDYIGYSIPRISAMFKQQTGASPIAYYNNLKIKEACRLLETTDLKIVQISRRLGIADQYYFSRLFSEIKGVSPKAYRQSHLS